MSLGVMGKAGLAVGLAAGFAKSRAGAFRRGGLFFGAVLLGASLSLPMGVALAQESAAPAAQPEAETPFPGLILTTDDVDTDPGGAFVSVGVQNTTAQTISQITVACDFSDGGTPVGTASTPLYSTPAGETGYGQVRLMGVIASSATCRITGAK